MKIRVAIIALPHFYPFLYPFPDKVIHCGGSRAAKGAGWPESSGHVKLKGDA